MDQRYKHIYLSYYIYATQAAYEKYAIENREEFLDGAFKKFKSTGSLETT